MWTRGEIKNPKKIAVVINGWPLMENPHRISATFELEFWTPYPLPGTELHNLYSFCLLFGYPHPTTVVVTYGVGTSLQSQPSSRQSSHHHPFYEGASLLPPLSSFFGSILCFLSPLHDLALNALRNAIYLKSAERSAHLGLSLTLPLLSALCGLCLFLPAAKHAGLWIIIGRCLASSLQSSQGSLYRPEKHGNKCN